MGHLPIVSNLSLKDLGDVKKPTQRNINSNTIINLASKEYFHSVKSLEKTAKIISPVFKDFSKGKYKIISFYAKKARGYMASWLVKNKIKKEQDIHSFSEEGYSFSIEESSNGVPVFLRG